MLLLLHYVLYMHESVQASIVFLLQIGDDANFDSLIQHIYSVSLPPLMWKQMSMSGEYHSYASSILVSWMADFL